jgi:ammonia channel protein AmtB
MGITTVMWWSVGYTLCFSGGNDGIFGNFHNAFLNHVGVNSMYAPAGIPLSVFIVYQMMFAIITPALITGAFTNRVTFKAYLIFLVVWQLAVYYPFVHMFWGGGLLADWGARDFAGGISCTRAPASRRSHPCSTSASGSSSTRRTTSRSSRSAPACSGSAGTASTPAAS